MLGIQLTDTDVDDVPLLATDPYGNFIPGPLGMPQMMFPEGRSRWHPADDPDTLDLDESADNIRAHLTEGDPSANGNLGISLVGARRTALRSSMTSPQRRTRFGGEPETATPTPSRAAASTRRLRRVRRRAARRPLHRRRRPGATRTSA